MERRCWSGFVVVNLVTFLGACVTAQNDPGRALGAAVKGALAANDGDVATGLKCLSLVTVEEVPEGPLKPLVVSFESYPRLDRKRREKFEWRLPAGRQTYHFESQSGGNSLRSVVAVALPAKEEWLTVNLRVNGQKIKMVRGSHQRTHFINGCLGYSGSATEGILVSRVQIQRRGEGFALPAPGTKNSTAMPVSLVEDLEKVYGGEVIDWR